MVARLYHCVGARSLRPLWTLEELGLPYELKVLPFPPRVHDKSYFAINPSGTVPAYVENGFCMTESIAICDYLATRHDPGGLSVRPGEPDYAAYLEWLHVGETTLTYPLTLVMRYTRFEPPERRLPQVAEDYTRVFLSRLRPLAALLDGGRTFLCADRFTIADISVGYALELASIAGLKDKLPGSVGAYRASLRARPAYARARAAEAAPTAKHQS